VTDPLPPTSYPLPFAVLFDLDGTLIDSIGLIVAAMEYAYGDRELRPPQSEWLAAIGTPLDGMLRRWARDDADVQHLRARYREFQNEHHDAMTTPYPGVIEAVRALHAAGHPLAVVTSKLEVGARRSLKYIGLEECFTVVVGLDSTTKHKPDPEPVHFALGRLGVRPERALFVGDSVHDIRSGNAAGVATAAALWGPSTRDELEPSAPAHWLAEFRAVGALVERLALK
jgi:pyrophosphatase PpaX